MDPEKQLPNNLFYFILSELDIIMGKNGKNVILKYSKLERLIDNPPTNDYSLGEPVRSFSELFTALIDVYGEKGFMAIVRGAGKKSFFQMIENLPGLFGIGSLDLEGKGPVERYKLVYETYIRNVDQMFGTTTIIKIEENRIVEDTPDCVWCVGIESRDSICIIESDFITGMGLWAGVENVKVVETHCKGKGDEICRFVVTF